MKNLDPQILESLAEMICVEGPGFKVPGPYRSMGEIRKFFRNAGVQARGTSETRKWFTLEALQNINGMVELEQVILRLASPHEYRNDSKTLHEVMKKLNQVLLIEGLKVALDGITPKIERTKATVASPTDEDKPVEPFNFSTKIADSKLARILDLRWKEAQQCIHSESYLSAVVMMGSILEGVLMDKAAAHSADANRARSAPKNGKTGKPKPIGDWGLSSLIDVAHEVGWIKGDRKRFSAALRDSRNIVHPYQQRVCDEFPDKRTCKICWQVVRAAIADLFGEDNFDRD